MDFRFVAANFKTKKIGHSDLRQLKVRTQSIKVKKRPRAQGVCKLHIDFRFEAANFKQNFKQKMTRHNSGFTIYFISHILSYMQPLWGYQCHFKKFTTLRIIILNNTCEECKF